jgi:uncharacterized protein
MRAKLPETVDARRLAHHGTRLDGELPASALERLAGAFGVLGPATAQLDFSWSDEQRVRVRGTLSVRLGCTCQRCLQAFEATILAEVDYELGEASRDAAQAFELMLEADGALDLAGFVEDELLLEAPMIPLHPDCSAPAADAPPEQPAGARRRPFAGLQELMDRADE